MSGSWTAASVSNVPVFGTIPASGSYTVIHKLGMSLFSSSKLLPTRYAPIEIEMSLSSTPGDWLTTTGSVSTTNSVQNVHLIYDEYALDESILYSFYSALLKNRVLSIPIMTAYQVVQAIPSGSTTFSFSAVRAFRGSGATGGTGNTGCTGAVGPNS